MKECRTCDETIGPSNSVPREIVAQMRKFLAIPFARLTIEKHEAVYMIEVTEKVKTTDRRLN